MYFEKLSVINYGPLLDYEFIFSPSGINLVVGPNGSGKTQLAGAIIATLMGPKHYQFAENYTDKRISRVELSIREDDQLEVVTYLLDNEKGIEEYKKFKNYSKTWPPAALQDKLIEHLVNPNQLPIIYNPDEDVRLVPFASEKYELIDRLFKKDNVAAELWRQTRKLLITLDKKGKLNQLEKIVSEGQRRVLKLAQDYINRIDFPYSIPLILDSPFWFLDPSGRGFSLELIEAIAQKDQVILISHLLNHPVVDRAKTHFSLPYPRNKISPICYKYGELKKTTVPKPYIVTEGKTDWKHIKAALNRFNSQYEFRSLEIEFFEHDEAQPMGSAELLKFCEQFSKLPQPRPIICIFDRDEESISRKVMPTEGAYKNWGNNVFSFIIPLPPHRKSHPDICIEFYYQDEDLKRLDNNGRRLFMSAEFDVRSGRHITDNLNCTILNKLSRYTIIDSNVFDAKNNNIALSKDDFASSILNQLPEFKDIDSNYFGLILKLIKDIARLHESEY